MATLTFEKSIEKLEKIVQELEKGGATLEKTISLYDEGLKLVTSCQEKLSTAALKIEELSKNATYEE